MAVSFFDRPRRKDSAMDQQTVSKQQVDIARAFFFLRIELLVQRHV
jgi:hypothetical protein